MLRGREATAGRGRHRRPKTAGNREGRQAHRVPLARKPGRDGGPCAHTCAVASWVRWRGTGGMMRLPDGKRNRGDYAIAGQLRTTTSDVSSVSA